MDHHDIKKLEATILEHVKNEELFPEVVRVLPPVYRQVEAAIVDIAQSEEMADHGEWSIAPTHTFLEGPAVLQLRLALWCLLHLLALLTWCGGDAAEDLAVLLLGH